MKLTRITGIVAGLSLLVAGMQAQVSLPAVFTDHMVLQQKSEVPVWGWGSASATIKVVGSWAPQDTATTVVRSDGTWDTTLKTIGAGGPYTLSVLGDGTRELKDVMLGEVWLCSGQSNMEWTPNARYRQQRRRGRRRQLSEYPFLPYSQTRGCNPAE